MGTFRSIEELVKSLDRETSERDVCQTKVSFVPL